MKDFIPVCEPMFVGNEKNYVDECLDTNWISSRGRFIEEFEKGLSGFLGVKEGVACCNGTTALHLAVRALGIGEGDEVILPTFTMAACVNAVLFVGASPVFVDADKETWCMDCGKIEEKITKKTRAIMAVHIYGHPSDMDVVMEVAQKHNLFVIEDAAEAHGAEYKGKKCGSIGDVGCFSFYANKIIMTGEGGMVVCNDSKIAEKMRSLRNMCFGEGAQRYLHTDLGFNYRMTNVQAAIGVGQIEKVEELVEARRKNALLYAKYLDIPGLILPVEKDYAKNVYWMYGIVLDDSVKKSKEQVMEELKEKGIDTRSFFVPLHKQPYLQKMLGSESYPVAEWLGERGLYLPSSSSLTEEDVKQVCEAVKEVLA